MESFARLKHFAFGHNQNARLLLASHVCQIFNGMKRYKSPFSTDFVFYTTCFMLYLTSHLLKLTLSYARDCVWGHFRIQSRVPNLLTEPPETLRLLNVLLLRSRDPDQSRSLCLLGTDRHSHHLTFSRSLRGLLIKLMLKIWNYTCWVT